MSKKYKDAPTIMDTEPGTCYLCGRGGDTARHHVYPGTAKRQISAENGFWVYLCPSCHKTVHRYPNSGVDKVLRLRCEYEFEKTHSIDEFRRLIGKSYR